MDRCTYDEKINNMLSDETTYKMLMKDPMKSCETKMKSLLSSKKVKLGDKLYKKLNTTDGATPRLYGLPKIHKEGIPLRPIVSFIGSTTYELSKYLSKILAPLVGNTEHHIRNTYDWVDKSKQFHLNDDEELVSFDVVSLFTSIPIELAIQIAALRLENDEQLPLRTPLTPQDVVELLEFCLKSTEFQFKDAFYKQIHGTAMGSPVSVVIANLVMEDLEYRALNTFPERPRLFYRFVDDTLAALKKTQIAQFHDHLNNQNQYIQFTVERYKESGIAFLDTMNTINRDGTISTTVYRKPTHSDRYLHYTSHHPIQQKASVARTLYYRAVKVNSDKNNQKREEKHVFKSLMSNGYPREFLQHVKKKLRRSLNTDTTSRREERNDIGLLVLPYIQGTTEKLKRVLEKHNINVSIKPLSTLKDYLMKPKDPLPNLKQTGVVYAIPCQDCDVEYIGETGRALGTRKTEHQRCVRLARTENSALAKHAHDNEHLVAWKDVKIVCKENRWSQRKWKEAWFIEKARNGISNRDNGRTLPEIYKPLIRKNF